MSVVFVPRTDLYAPIYNVEPYIFGANAVAQTGITDISVTLSYSTPGFSGVAAPGPADEIEFLRDYCSQLSHNGEETDCEIPRILNEVVIYPDFDPSSSVDSRSYSWEYFGVSPRDSCTTNSSNSDDCVEEDPSYLTGNVESQFNSDLPGTLVKMEEAPENPPLRSNLISHSSGDKVYMCPVATCPRKYRYLNCNKFVQCPVWLSCFPIGNT
jgi:hypothetical protein